MKIYTKTLLSTALVALIAVPAFAAETKSGKKNKEITEIVGYDVTETTTYEGPHARTFYKIDANSDGVLTFKEYRDFSTVDNEYEMFSLIDKDQSKNITMEEYVTANVTKGSTHIDSALHGRSVKGTNLKTRALPQVKSYYEPVTPTVVEVRDLKTGEIEVGAEARAEVETMEPASGN